MPLMGEAADRPILVVDDDAKTLRLVRMYLEREGFRVIEARDGREALPALGLETPALVILDLMLPEVDGLAVIRAVRRNDRTPIVVLSARGTTNDRISGLAAGADDYVPKPFSPAELVLRVKRVLDRTAGGTGDGVRRGPLTHGDLVVDPDRHEARIAGSVIALTRVEFRLLLALLQAGGPAPSRGPLLPPAPRGDRPDILHPHHARHNPRLRGTHG